MNKNAIELAETENCLASTVTGKNSVTPETQAGAHIKSTERTNDNFGNDTPDSNSLIKAAGRGVVWQFAGAGWTTVIQLGTSAVLARLLDPGDFGVMGMALLAKGFIGRVAGVGSTVGVVAKQSVSREDLSTAFWINATVNMALFLIGFAAAPLAAVYFNMQEVVWVLRAVSLTFLFNGLSGVSGAILRRRLRFGTLKIIEGGTFLLQSGLTIILAAVLHWNYWALVMGTIIAAFVQSLATVISAGWRPGFCFVRGSFNFMARYGVNELGTSFLSYFHNNIDYLLIGRLLGASSLGLYEFAYRLPHMVVNRIAAPVGKVLLPTFSSVQSDNERIASGCIKASRYIATIVLPMLVGLASLARPAVLVIWGAKWLPIVLPLQILCCRAALSCILGPATVIFPCKNRPDIPFKISLATLVFTFAVVAGLGFLYGINGVAIGMAVAMLPVFFSVWLAFHMLEINVFRYFKGLLPPLTATLFCGFAALATRMGLEIVECHDAIVLVCGTAAGGFAYIASLWFIFPGFVKEVRSNFWLVLSKKGKSRPHQA